VSSANDNAEIGEKVAITNSREELWPLMGYELRSKLAYRKEPMTLGEAVAMLPDQEGLYPPFGVAGQ